MLVRTGFPRGNIARILYVAMDILFLFTGVGFGAFIIGQNLPNRFARFVKIIERFELCLWFTPFEATASEQRVPRLMCL